MVAAKKQAFDRVAATVWSCKDLNFPLCTKLTKHQGTKDIKLTFQHLGGNLSSLPNGKKSTFIDAIANQYGSAFDNKNNSLNVTTITLNETSTENNKHKSKPAEHTKITKYRAF